MVKLTKVLEDVPFTSNTNLNELDKIEIVDIAYSSLRCKADYMFVALKGETVDGHKYVFDAYSRGARVFVLQDDIEMAEDAVKIIVKDTRVALSKMSANFFGPGDTVKVHVKIIEGKRERIQVFEGVVIKRQGGGNRETFTVRKISFNVGVERTFPVHSPKIEKIEVTRRGKVRRAKINYLRTRTGKAAKVKEARNKR